MNPMKKVGLFLASVSLCWGLTTCNAGASQFSNGLGKTFSYLTSPINCLARLGADLVTVGTNFVVCVLNNINPRNIIP